MNLNFFTLLKLQLENPPFLTKIFQLHDICNYVSIGFFLFKNKIMAIAN
jgi:hypothetical protein